MTTKLSSGDKAVAGCLTALIVGVVTALGGGWMLMLAAGIGHSYFPAVPPLGYWPSVGIFLVLNALIGYLRSGTSKASS